MPILFFDTETTGKADFRSPSVAMHQPRLVQLGAILYDDDRRELGTIDAIVKPDGWQVPVEASNVHGIPHALAERAGSLIVNVVSLFRDFLFVADKVVAHNIVFDELVMDRAAADADLAAGLEVTYPWSQRHQLICTMREATPIAKVPSKRAMHREDYKWPTLNECSQRFFGKEVVGAHNALVDVKACAEIYFKLVDDGVITDKSGRKAKNTYD